jgi:hypothetical protein
MSTGAPLNLTLEPTGTVGWGTAVNANFTSLNSAIAALQAGGTTGAQGNPGSAGPVGIIWAGPWGAGTPYVAQDAVSFNGSSYLAQASNTGVQPDTHPSTWALLALAGSQGIQGIQGIQGPPGSGGGSSITFPITIVEGGTGAGDAVDARVNLGAAASGHNSDITSLSAITTGTSTSGQQGITVTSPGGQGNALTVTNGDHAGGITTDGGFFAVYIECAGQITCAEVVVSSVILVGGIGEAVANAGTTFANKIQMNNGIILQGAIPTAGAGQIAFGAGTSGTATAGSSGSLPATPAGYLIFNNQGTQCKIPYYNN